MLFAARRDRRQLGHGPGDNLAIADHPNGLRTTGMLGELNLGVRRCNKAAVSLTADLPRARGGQRSQRLECRGGVAALLGAIRQHVLSTGVRDVEPVGV